MAADSNIFQQYLQPVRSVADYSADMDRQEQNKIALAAARMQSQQAGQAMADDRAMREAYTASGGDMNKLQQLLTSGGQYAAAQKLQGAQLAAQKTKADVGKTEAEVLEKNLSVFRSYVPQVQTPEQAGQYAAAMYDHPVLGQLAKDFGSRDEAIRRNMEAFRKDPRAWMMNSAGVSADKLLEMHKGIRQNINMGGTMQGQTVNAYGEVVPGQTTNTPITQSADNRASVGASLANAGATREVAQATRDAARIQRDGETERKMGDDYRAQSKGFGEASSAFKQINATLDSATTSPAATLAAATKFMKILDPGSVVRESELGMALASSGVIDRIGNYVNILQRGKVLTPVQVADFKNVSRQMYSAAQQVQQTIDADYKSKAKAYGLRPEMVTQELGQNSNKVVNFSDLK